MNKRKLKRQLGLVQVVMLGTAGAIGAEIFVLTGHAAGISGPAFVLALIIAGVFSYSIALNYGELASSFPETGGAMTYVREAWGPNILTFLVGSLDCLSSTFYAGLSAIGFAYSLQIFFPILPIVPTAIAIILVFIGLNIMGVGNVGNVQIILGGILLVVFSGYILLGFLSPGGFQWNTYLFQGKFFIHQDSWSNFTSILSTVALIYVAYIGFEVIADDAEEITNPDRNIPFGILTSLSIMLIFYPLIALVTLGTIPWTALAGSDAALSDASNQFLPKIGPLILGVTGIIATITTLNSAMLSATREAFTLSRDGMWPRFLSLLGRFRTPYWATIMIGAIICLVAAIGLVDFLSYISSSGYLFVLFWSNLALIRLRKRYPDLRRPFRVPLFPLTAYLGMGTCVFIIAFTEKRALAFGVGLIVVLSSIYYLSPLIQKFYIKKTKTIESLKNRILVPVANPNTGAQLVQIAALLAQAIEDTSICVFNVIPQSKDSSNSPAQLRKQDASATRSTSFPDQVLQEVRNRNVPLYTKTRQDGSIAIGILNEVNANPNIKLILAGWPGPLNSSAGKENPIQILLEKAQTNVAVFLSHHQGKFHTILVPVGGGLHSRLALRLAYEIAEQENAKVVAFQTYRGVQEAEEIEDHLINLRQIVEEELGKIPVRFSTRITQADSVSLGIMAETKRMAYDLLVMGASAEYGSGTRLFGSIDDWVIEHVENCSVLLVRRHESTIIRWIRRYLKKMEK